jgi:hypothetical protein
MIHELVYTSVPQGLRTGSSGFSVVAMTAGMHPMLVQHLEKISNFRHINSPGQFNPASHSFSKKSIQNKSYFILSRIVDAGLDYSGRSNHLAHHLIIESISNLNAGPAWYLSQAALFLQNWTGAPRILQPKELRGKPDGPKPCSIWQRETGDAGWATESLDAILTGKSCTMIVSPQTDCLSLIQESIALLPEWARWNITFSSNHTKSADASECQWRFVLRGTPEALVHSTPTNVVIDLTSKLPKPTNRFALAARNGTYLELDAAHEELKRKSSPELKVPSGQSTSAAPLLRKSSPVIIVPASPKVDLDEPPPFRNPASTYADSSTDSWAQPQRSIASWVILAAGSAHQKGAIFRTSIKYRESSAQASRLFLTPRLLVFS